MNKRKGYEDYDYLAVDVIKNACNGDGNALGKVVARYDNYARTCMRHIARNEFGLDDRYIPMDDLLQVLWIELIKVIVNKFYVTE